MNTPAPTPEGMTDEELAFWRGPNEYRPYAMPLVDRLLATISAQSETIARLTAIEAAAREYVDIREVIEGPNYSSLYDIMQAGENMRAAYIMLKAALTKVESGK